ncbi:MAG TPA: transketolase [Gaiellales bacterium]|nr:transketolase [Gaiellales bacterium]
MPQPFDDIDQLCVNTVRTLSLDAVEQAKSGHPGLPMGAAPMAHVLWTRHLRYNPADPAWPGRDRFVLSGGHGCMLLYSLLHLTGYDLPLEELKRFRQWGSMTPGHPEYGHTPGVETTTGPLGQGAANAVGMAIAAKHLEAIFGPDAGFRVYAIVTDGDLMEGVSGEASSIAGHLGLDNLLFLYDDNHVTIDGDTELAFTEDRAARYAAYGWHTSTVADGNDMEAIDAAIEEAKAVSGRPSIISVKTIIGFGSRDAGTSRAHSDARGPEQQAETKRALGFDPEQFFVVPDAARERYRQALDRGARLQQEWTERMQEHPRWEELQRIYAGAVPDELSIEWFSPEEKPMATRAASGKVIAQVGPQVPEMVGGSADLTPSNNTKPPDWEDFEPGHYDGRYLRFGVREHGMGGIVNGLVVSHLRAFGATFFNFLDYMKPAVRLSALMNIPAIWIYTHDSIGLGEDGPTHQPVEQLATLRATPNITTFRPADANETTIGWRIALARRNPTALILSRQALPVLDAGQLPIDQAVRGGYVLEGDEDPAVLLIATGAEVHTALEARKLLAEDGITSRVVSLPSFELFDEQPESYREQVIPPSIEARVCIEAGASLGWERFAGDRGAIVALDRFGASAPGTSVLEHLGFTPRHVADEAQRVLSHLRQGGVPS